MARTKVSQARIQVPQAKLERVRAIACTHAIRDATIAGERPFERLDVLAEDVPSAGYDLLRSMFKLILQRHVVATQIVERD